MPTLAEINASLTISSLMDRVFPIFRQSSPSEKDIKVVVPTLTQ